MYIHVYLHTRFKAWYFCPIYSHHPEPPRYQHGIGVRRDAEKSSAWTLRAAQNGHRKAATCFFWWGRGVFHCVSTEFVGLYTFFKWWFYFRYNADICNIHKGLYTGVHTCILYTSYVASCIHRIWRTVLYIYTLPICLRTFQAIVASRLESATAGTAQ